MSASKRSCGASRAAPRERARRKHRIMARQEGAFLAAAGKAFEGKRSPMGGRACDRLVVPPQRHAARQLKAAALRKLGLCTDQRDVAKLVSVGRPRSATAFDFHRFARGQRRWGSFPRSRCCLARPGVVEGLTMRLKAKHF